MFLHQEYLSRHQIDAGWMGYPTNGTLVFRSVNPDRHRWLLLSFIKQGPEYHPQEYRVETVVPKRNCGEHSGPHGICGTTRRHVLDEDDSGILWDSFEVWIRKYISKAHKLRMVRDPVERELTLWEMYVYCNDSRFANWGFAFKKLLFHTLDLEQSVEKRRLRLKELKSVMKAHSPKMLQRFELCVSNYKEDKWIGENEKRLLNSND